MDPCFSDSVLAARPVSAVLSFLVMRLLENHFVQTENEAAVIF